MDIDGGAGIEDADEDDDIMPQRTNGAAAAGGTLALISLCMISKDLMDFSKSGILALVAGPCACPRPGMSRS